MSAKPQITAPAGIAVVGLGNMGVPMGACLVKAGYVVRMAQRSSTIRRSASPETASTSRRLKASNSRVNAR